MLRTTYFINSESETVSFGNNKMRYSIWSTYLSRLPYSPLLLFILISIELSPSWVADVRSAIREYPKMTLDRKTQYHVHKNSSLVLKPSEMNLVHKIINYYSDIRLNINITHTFRSSLWTLAFLTCH
jgi:hypothetical protein